MEQPQSDPWGSAFAECDFGEQASDSKHSAKKVKQLEADIQQAMLSAKNLSQQVQSLEGDLDTQAL